MSANWQLTNQHLKVWSDGSLWLTLHRKKTKVPVNVKLLPVLSYQKCNEYLKEMAAGGINKAIVQLAQQLGVAL